MVARQGDLTVQGYARSAVSIACVALAGLLLVGCGNPYALNVNRHNYSAEQVPGVIQFSDPKLYSREHLINERREELSFLDGQLGRCNTDSIAPEIIREIEVVQALSANVGLKFDPAAAINFENQSEIAEIKNEIARNRLEMQLAQLRRDAELLEQQLDAQEEVSSQQDTSSGDNGPTEVGSSVEPPELSQLTKKIDQLIGELQTDAQTAATKLEDKGAKAGPIETFHHRKACRDTVKNAINQVRLDELHDHDGNVLVRLQFRATVLPGSKEYDDTLGILRMEVEPPEIDKNQISNIYRNWLDYVNQNINVPPSRDEPGSVEKKQLRMAPKFSVLQDYFDVVYVEIPKYRSDGTPVGDGQTDCSGIHRKKDHPETCWYAHLAVPPGEWQALDVQAQASGNLENLLLGATKDIEQNQNFKDYVEGCDANKFDNNIQLNSDVAQSGATAFQAYQIASEVKRTNRFFVATMEALHQSLDLNDMPKVFEALAVRDSGLSRAAVSFLNLVDRLNPECDLPLQFSVPDTFSQALKQAKRRVVAYDVAPAERVQPVSTAARAAEAVALAASIAGSLPTQGLGASGEVAFSRAAVGKADTLELAPIVVGFTEPVQTTHNESDATLSAFGWLLGPKAVLNPKRQELKFVHPLKPYEVFADLSIPGWWPEFSLKTQTAWAPNWRAKQDGKTLDIDGETLDRTIRVPMRSNNGDMDGLTSVLLKAARLPGLGSPRIRMVEPREVSACANEVDFQIWGDNVWRASMIHFGGRAVDREKTENAGKNTTTAIRVLPDMRGVMASVDVSTVPNRAGGKSVLTVWTPDGRDTYDVKFSDRPTDNGSCVARTVATRPTATQLPSISQIVPSEVSVCSDNVTFMVQGENLGSPLGATFNGIQAQSIQEVEPNDGTLARYVIDLAPHRKQLAGLANANISLRTPHGLASTQVMLQGELGACD